MLSPKTRRNISRIIPFGVLWLIFGSIYSLLEKGILGDLQYYPSTGNPYDFEGSIVLSTGLVAIGGLLIGTFEILYLSKRFNKKSLLLKFVFKTAIYLTFIVTFLLVTAFILNAIELQTSLLDQQVLRNVWVFATNFAFLGLLLYTALLISVSLFFSEVSLNLGHQVLTNFITGKYHSPIQEDRIFMFLDMKSSTTIAEKLGHVRYFEMLNQYYADLSDPIIQFEGEIYQYVGDEIIVSWKLHQGLRGNNCLECFFAMKKALRKQSEKYNTRFGLLPAFKAGFHHGNVTTGEIGTIKKDIIFTGDVLNTTARIQGLCNELGAEILMSDSLLNKLELNATYQIKSLGEKQLRGREEKIALFTIVQS